MHGSGSHAGVLTVRPHICIGNSRLSVQCSIAFHPPYLKLIEKILPLMPDPSLNSFFWWNSGSEAIEAAIKIARTATGRQNIISMQGTRNRTNLGPSHERLPANCPSQVLTMAEPSELWPLRRARQFTAKESIPLWRVHIIFPPARSPLISRAVAWGIHPPLPILAPTRPTRIHAELTALGPLPRAARPPAQAADRSAGHGCDPD